jgi:hypothetical protein
MSVPQWLWYSAQFAADDQDQFELLRDIAEYNASFWNPEGVNQVRQAREKAIVVSDKDFAKQVEETFGRKLMIPEKKDGALALPFTGMEKPRRPKMREDMDGNAYLDAELDEVRFTPIRR